MFLWSGIAGGIQGQKYFDLEHFVCVLSKRVLKVITTVMINFD